MLTGIVRARAIRLRASIAGIPSPSIALSTGGFGGMNTVDVTEFLRECSPEPCDGMVTQRRRSDLDQSPSERRISTIDLPP